jgi:outer membrane protein OmpU
MNKLTKVGVSALCGSLAAVSAASAGEMTVSGGATVTYTSLDYGVTGNPLGMASGVAFAGSGELDNGNAVSFNVAHDDQNAYSSSDVSLTTSLGKFTFDQGGGTGIDRYDDAMPSAWEESYDTGVGSGLQTVSGVGGGTDIEWSVSEDMLPEGMNVYISYSPKPDGATVNDKSTSGAGTSSVSGKGYDVVVSSSGLADGLNVFAGITKIDQGDQDHGARVLGFTYAAGGATVGYQMTTDNISAKTVDAYENRAFGISFAVNDDLSISYGQHKSEKVDGSLAGIEVKTSSMQAAYTMGGATVKIAQSSVDNALYASGTANEREGTTIALSLAF